MKYHLASKANKTLQQLWKKRPKKIQNENSWVRIVSGLFKIVVFKVTFMRHPSLSKGKGSVQSFVLFRSSFPVNHKPTWGKKKKKVIYFHTLKKWPLCSVTVEQTSYPPSRGYLQGILCYPVSFVLTALLEMSKHFSAAWERVIVLPVHAYFQQQISVL